MNEETNLPEGLQLAVKLLAQIGDVDSDAAIAAVHAACDLARRVADLERLNGMHKAAWLAYQPLGDYMQALSMTGKLPVSTLGRHLGDVAIERMQAQAQRIAELETERNTARGAVRELERQVFALQQQRDVLQTCLDRRQRDAGDPPGYLQDAVIRAAGLGALHEERDAAIKERDALRARLAEIEAQEPVAISKAGNLFWAGNPQDWRGVDCSLYPRPVPAQAVPTGERQAVLLTDAAIAEAFLSRCPAHLRGEHDVRDMQARPDVMALGRAIEAAVLTANGLEVRRG